MLIHLYINQFAAIQALELDLSDGLTVITGESGAGKSILLGALSLAIGSRGSTHSISWETDQADVVATFDVSGLPDAEQWLSAYQLAAHNQCILRRVLSRDGRSKAFINGIPATVAQLRKMGALLVNVHQQQGHQRLLQRSTQLEMLDSFAGQLELRAEVAALHSNIADIEKQLQTQSEMSARATDQFILLDYQIQELKAVAIAADELPRLDQEHRRLANIQAIRATVGAALMTLAEQDESIITMIQHHLRQLEQIQDDSVALKAGQELMSSSLVHLQEGVGELQQYFNAANEEPEQLKILEERLTKIYDLARKYKVQPEQTYRVLPELEQKKQQLEQAQVTANELRAQLQELQASHQAKSLRLRKYRLTAAKKMTAAISAYLLDLGMANGYFQIELSEVDAFTYGLDQVVFLFSASKRYPPQPLEKVASGGELSRLSLAIELILATDYRLPTLIFDEADAGIGGATAAKIGQLLKRLSKQAQILCVTHLPQIAVYGNQHIHVEKNSQLCDDPISLKLLSLDERTVEIARMLDGDGLTKRNLAHAGEMLQKAASL